MQSYLQTEENTVKLDNFETIPANIHPADHMSIEVEYILAPNNTSGGLYHSVTTYNRKIGENL